MSQKFLKQVLNLFLIRIIDISNQYETGTDYIQGHLNEAYCQLVVFEQKFSGGKKREF
ncbi:MAG TPA: hypothetical protein PK657_03620 [Legionella sp.]|nr:hypothetical protein [Legionella sp.]